MSRTYADFQGEDITARELDLEQRLRAGDPQVADELPAFLQSRFLRRAYQYLRDYRHVLPAYLEAVDLVQEACLVVLKCLEEARAKDSPFDYLIAVGYHAMRYFCFSFTQEPCTQSLDQPCFPDDETPLHEYLSTSLLPVSPYLQEDEDRYMPLYHALEQLSAPQRAVLLRLYGLQEHPVMRQCDIERELGWYRMRAGKMERKALATLALALKDAYPHYVGDTPPTGYQLSDAQRARLDQAYARLQSQGRAISVRVLRREAKTSDCAASAYLWEKEGSPRFAMHQNVQQRLDQAYARLQSQGRAISVRVLRREAKSGKNAAGAYLKQKRREAHL
jgi:DNA-directed RNA polymerase specialized sigma24 family protein